MKFDAFWFIAFIAWKLNAFKSYNMLLRQYYNKDQPTSSATISTLQLHSRQRLDAIAAQNTQPKE